MSRRCVTAALFFFALGTGRSPGLAHDWPQFLGPRRDGIYRDDDFRLPRGDEAPGILWRRKVGEGFSAPVAARGRIYMFHREGDEEVLECLEAESGKRLWRSAYPSRYRDAFGFNNGPRATPCVDSGRVYTLGAEGMLSAADARSGAKLWRVSAGEKYGAEEGYFGFASSPLVFEGRVLVNLGGKKGAGVVAFDAVTGRELWRATDHEASYSSGVVREIAGRPHAFFFTREGLVDLDPRTGGLRWSLRWRARIAASVNAATPVTSGDLVFVSACYGTGALLVRCKGDRPQKVWSGGDILSNHYATSVLSGGCLYGFHGRQEYGPAFRCVDFTTGKVFWSKPRFGAGTVTRIGGALLIVLETGELVVAAADSKAYRETARARVLAPTVRAYPAVAGGILYLRNDDTLIALDCRKGGEE